ncbi:putative nuclease HARBI1 [Tanacetum coccineum]|uniref:Nuclease HARBI1 n=1 Tax=Tanacetum coccineum TaxID=301880 RepID=A0ABQ5FJY3_9ASTR
MASQDARLSKFEANFKQQQSEMTNKIYTVLKTISDQITRALPSNTDEQRDAPQLELKYPIDIEKIGPSRNDKEREIEWLDVKGPLDLVDTCEESIILSEDDYDRGCRKPSDLEDGFYKDTIKLGPEYVTGIADEGEVTTQQLAVIHVVCLVVAYLAKRRFRKRNRINLPSQELILHRRAVREEMLQDVSTNNNCRKIIRMSVDAFKILCQKLENECGLRPTQRMSVEEQVARFLHIVGNDFRTRFVSWLYRRSVSATSRHFHRVLNAIISLEDQYIKQPTGDIVQKEIQDKPRFYPFFKDCIGAIDGTHVRVRVPNRDAPRYRGRKGYPTINVLVACTFDLKFTYVLSGWEGTTSDSRIVKDAVTRNDKLIIPDGKYYLADGGRPHRSTLIAPYRGVRYHLKEYSARAP